MFIQSSFLLASLAIGTLAAPTPDTILHEKRSWDAGKIARVPGDAIIPLRIGLMQSNLEHGYAKLMDVSHPSSSKFGNHWSLDEVEDFFAPSEESSQAVEDWLIASGIDSSAISTSRNRGWIAVDLPARVAESLLNAEYHEYESLHDGSLRIGCDEYHLPRHVAGHVDFIKPGITFSPPLKKKTMLRRGELEIQAPQKSKRAFRFGSGPAASVSTGTNDTSCGSSITPACIKALYNIPNTTVSTFADSGDELGIYENDDFYAQEDLDSYFAEHAPHVPQGTAPTVNGIDGATAPVVQDEAGGESDIDLQMAFSLVYPTNVTLYQVADIYPTDSTFITPFLDAIDGSFCQDADESAGDECGVYNLTTVLSMSYTSPELNPMGGSIASQQRSCNEIMKLTLQGHTIVISSGDYGVAAHPSAGTNGCVSQDGKRWNAKNGTVFQPQFPATCPYVLSVGATQLDVGQSASDFESVMNPGPESVSSLGIGTTFSSSGGFANYFEAPDYQANALSTYFSEHDPGYAYYSSKNGSNIGLNNGLYNRNGRAIPDVSANGAFFASIIRGKPEQEFGTSLAAPLWASLITLMNQERYAAGKGPVGFINPTLYANPDVFNDITTGTNPGCNTNGFEAVEGWDPSTGLGTPDYPALLQVILDLP